jgi:phosphoadenosine phosphosulfate reductase
VSGLLVAVDGGVQGPGGRPSRVRSGPEATLSRRPRRLPRIPPDAEQLEAHAVLRLALDALGPDRLALSASFGPESIVILDLLADMRPRPRVFTLDTGRLPQATHDLMDRVRERFDVEIEVYTPDPGSIGAMVAERGSNLFYRSLDDRLRCCDVRKVEPLGVALASVDGWITGLRRDQTPTRVRTPKLSLDLEHGLIWKVCPLADWSSERVWEWIHKRDLPYNELHDQGYPSIGCAPCTRAVAPDEDPRSGRWWWETPESRECGLHVDRASIVGLAKPARGTLETAV